MPTAAAVPLMHPATEAGTQRTSSGSHQDNRPDNSDARADENTPPKLRAVRSTRRRSSAPDGKPLPNTSPGFHCLRMVSIHHWRAGRQLTSPLESVEMKRASTREVARCSELLCLIRACQEATLFPSIITIQARQTTCLTVNDGIHRVGGLCGPKRWPLDRKRAPPAPSW